jgi:hypothetical protein
VLINLSGSEGDAEWAAQTRKTADGLVAEARTRTRKVAQDVEGRLSGS